MEVAVKRFKTSSAFASGSSSEKRSRETGGTGKNSSEVTPEIYMQDKSVKRMFVAEMELMHHVSKVLHPGPVFLPLLCSWGLGGACCWSNGS